MKNFEKYKDYLAEAIVLYKLNKLLELAGIDPTEVYASNYDENKKSLIDWLSQDYKEPILDDVERKYLADVIRPFRKEVATISKFNSFDGSQYIYIGMKDSRGCNLPTFPKGTMYKGMIEGMHYSLKELGL